MPKGTSLLDVSRAQGWCCLASTREKGGGGGRMQRAKECGLHKGNIKEENVNGGLQPNGTAAHGDLFESKSVVKLSRRGIENLVKLEKRSEVWVVVVYAPWCRFCQAMEESYVELAEKLAGSGVKVGKFRGDGEDKSIRTGATAVGEFPYGAVIPKTCFASSKISIREEGCRLLAVFCQCP